jgi:hypothetical protein
VLVPCLGAMWNLNVIACTTPSHDVWRGETVKQCYSPQTTVRP